MQQTPKDATNRAPWKEIALAALIVVGGWAAVSGVLQASLPDKNETPVAQQAPLTPDRGYYDAQAHGDTIEYWGRTYRVTPKTVTIADADVSAAGDSMEDVRIWYRNDVSAANKLPATYPESGPIGGANSWNRDADEHAGGGGGAASYPDDKGPLLVKVGPNTYRQLMPVMKK